MFKGSDDVVLWFAIFVYFCAGHLAKVLTSMPAATVLHAIWLYVVCFQGLFAIATIDHNIFKIVALFKLYEVGAVSPNFVCDTDGCACVTYSCHNGKMLSVPKCKMDVYPAQNHKIFSSWCGYRITKAVWNFLTIL